MATITAHYSNGAEVQEGDTVKLPDGTINRVRWVTEPCLPGSKGCNGKNACVRLAFGYGKQALWFEMCAGLLKLVKRQSKRTHWTHEMMAEKNKASGSHWFDPGAVRFFSTRYVGAPICGPGGVFFVTSERFTSHRGNGPRLYSVRSFNPRTGYVDTVGAFNVLSKTQAIKAARLCALGGKAKIARALGIK